MSGEFTPEKKTWLTPAEFVTNALGAIGAESLQTLEPKEIARIAMAFHLDRCDRDDIEWLPQLDMPEGQKEVIWEFLCARSAEMRTLLEIVIGYEGDYDFDIEDLLPR